LNAQYKLEVPIHARSKIKSVLIQYLKAFVIAVLSMLAGASVVHAIMKPDLTVPVLTYEQMQAEAAAKAAEKERRRLEARQRNEEALLEQKKQREEAELKAKQQAELKAKPS